MVEEKQKRTGILGWLKHKLNEIKKRSQTLTEEEIWEEASAEGNPFLPQLRWILEQILDKYAMDYRTFRQAAGKKYLWRASMSFWIWSAGETAITVT